MIFNHKTCTKYFNQIWSEISKKKAIRGTTDAAWIRFINKCKVLVALRKFREVIRPYDTRDVIERFNTGQSEMLLKWVFFNFPNFCRPNQFDLISKLTPIKTIFQNRKRFSKSCWRWSRPKTDNYPIVRNRDQHCWHKQKTWPGHS